MSSKLRNLALTIIKTNKTPLDINSIVSEIKKSPEFSRQKDESLRPIIKNLLKELKQQKIENSSKEKNEETLIQKKRKREIK